MRISHAHYQRYSLMWVAAPVLTLFQLGWKEHKTLICFLCKLSKLTEKQASCFTSIGAVSLVKF